ncbi:hypothetical protein [[Clostridium] fimetarium]|uniref:Uncharacterized protein n=1 Tax=[Clostridium] fimetarium TaxID=99656 RepID=A0A1I0QBK7_9FIRM|nr:hypothetical protein [[Clostridium] fimetarium]SEW24299.1 hypothetical protein SAMN05421659_107158 [[Clostridium] fimetarium]
MNIHGYILGGARANAWRDVCMNTHTICRPFLQTVCFGLDSDEKTMTADFGRSAVKLIRVNEYSGLLFVGRKGQSKCGRV